MKKDIAEQFDKHTLHLATITKALGHPARIAILKFLQEHNHQTCKNIVEQLPFSQSTVSQHLAELKQAGLIDAESFKTSMIYSVTDAQIEGFRKSFDSVFGKQGEKKQLSLF